MDENTGLKAFRDISGVRDAIGGQIRQAQQAASFLDFRADILVANGTTFVAGGTRFSIIVNDEAIYRAMAENVENAVMMQNLIYEAKKDFLPEMKDLLIQIVQDRAAGLPDGAWPEKYTTHVIEGINKYVKEPEIKRLGVDQVIIELPDLQKSLGTYEEYTVAFHHGAILRGSTKGNIKRADVRIRPFDEHELFVKVAARRYRYWRALQAGDPTTTIYRKGGKKQTIKIEGDWQDTIDARIEAWNNIKKAPEWELLDVGQPRWKPTIPASPFAAVGISSGAIVLGWVYALEKRWTQLVRRIWDTQIQKFNRTNIPNITSNSGRKFAQQSFSRRGRNYIAWRDAKGRFSGGGYE